jgi:hypothetical protein
MEKGNGQDAATQPGTTTVPAGSATGTSTSAGPGTETGTVAVPPTGSPSTGGGGQQADQSGPGQGQTQERRREVLFQGPHEASHRDGSTLRLDGQGGATFKDGPHTARLEGNRWVDSRTGEPADRGLTTKADHRLRSVEMARGLRKSMMP